MTEKEKNKVDRYSIAIRKVTLEKIRAYCEKVKVKQLELIDNLWNDYEGNNYMRSSEVRDLAEQFAKMDKRTDQVVAFIKEQEKRFHIPIKNAILGIEDVLDKKGSFLSDGIDEDDKEAKIKELEKKLMVANDERHSLKVDNERLKEQLNNKEKEDAEFVGDACFILAGLRTGKELIDGQNKGAMYLLGLNPPDGSTTEPAKYATAYLKKCGELMLKLDGRIADMKQTGRWTQYKIQK